MVGQVMKRICIFSIYDNAGIVDRYIYYYLFELTKVAKIIIVVNGGINEEGLEKLLPLEEKYGDWWNLLFMIGLAYKNMGEMDKAKEYYEKILRMKPQQVDTLVELALCEASSLNMNRAIELLEAAAKLKEDPEILCNLGMAYLNVGNFDDANYYIERAYELNPEDEVTVACKRELAKYI